MTGTLHSSTHSNQVLPYQRVVYSDPAKISVNVTPTFVSFVATNYLKYPSSLFFLGMSRISQMLQQHGIQKTIHRV
jgi:hypothetical protein